MEIELRILKALEDPIAVRISAGVTNDGKNGYVVYRGNLQKVKEAMALLNDYVQRQTEEAPRDPRDNAQHFNPN